ncbi:MAG TPA: hypothetical protein PL110_00645 [Candidatus Eremiobacteraeota bacterium]|nr:MAG: hypothetical protein BWY64_00028 [bacterium ADurb.Bin363]HPZ06595.1 hypothetical protein [Candidatus Eremiobacteraeota bacterium]
MDSLNVNVQKGSTRFITSKQPEKSEPKDRVDLLNEQVDKGTLSKDIAARLKELKKQNIQDNQPDTGVTKCYLPVYGDDYGPWFKGKDEKILFPKPPLCYLPMKEGITVDPPILCYAPMKDKAIIDPPILCYAPMKAEEKMWPKPLCYLAG